MDFATAGVSRARPDRPQARSTPLPPPNSVPMDVALEQLEMTARRRLGMPMPAEEQPANYVASSSLSAASQSLYTTRAPQTNVVVVSNGAQDPVHGLMDNSWATCALLFESLPEDCLYQLLTSPEGPTLLLTPAELTQWSPKISPFLTLCSEMRRSELALGMAAWHARVSSVCADVERQHCELIQLGDNVVRVTVVHFGDGLFGHLLFLTGREPDLTVLGVSNVSNEEPHELFRFYMGFVSVSVELAAKDLQ